MTTQLTFICQAPTSANRTFRFSADEPIDGPGLKKLDLAAVGPSGADRLWSSPALAARETAEILGFASTVDLALRDCDYGRWSGRSFEDVLGQEPEAVAEWLRDPAASPHGGESILSLIARVAEWLGAQNGLMGSIVAVTHAPVVRAAMVHAIGAPPQSFWRIDVAPLSMTRFSGNDGRWNLTSLHPLEAKRG